MRLVGVSTLRDGNRVRVVGTVQPDDAGQAIELFFEYPAACEPWLCTTGDAYVAALVPAAMQRGEDLHIDVPVSNDVLDWVIELQDLYASWFPDVMRRVTIHAPHRQPMRNAQLNHVAAFFSMGVDSFYTLLKNMRGRPSPAGPITHLLYVEGLDTPLGQVSDASQTRTVMQEVAAAAGKELLVGRTNLRDHFPLDYGLYYSGPCLSAVALSLAPAFTNALIAGATEYARLYPSASHPLVEGRVRSGHFRVISDGGELNRLQRIVQLVGSDPLSLKYLRVCTQNRSGAHNCGQCQKCLRTMVTLHLMGTLKQCATFSDDFDSKMIRRLSIRNDWDLHYLEEIVVYAAFTNADPAVTRELRRLFGIYRRWTWWNEKLKRTPLRFVVPMLDSTWRGARELRSRLQSGGMSGQQHAEHKQLVSASEQ